jgi:hypothetical protein
VLLNVSFMSHGVVMCYSAVSLRISVCIVETISFRSATIAIVFDPTVRKNSVETSIILPFRKAGIR